jgi:hypothetical protein
MTVFPCEAQDICAYDWEIWLGMKCQRLDEWADKAIRLQPEPSQHRDRVLPLCQMNADGKGNNDQDNLRYHVCHIELIRKHDPISEKPPSPLLCGNRSELSG